MDENEAVEQQQVATPIFNVYRRGYDPEQVDRYVADQQRRLDDALHRASESERRLAAAVGQLRELHRRVAAYESETRTAQPPSLTPSASASSASFRRRGKVRTTFARRPNGK